MIRLIVVIFILSIAVTMGAEIYKWIDSDGDIHYSDSPPNEQKSEKLQVMPGPGEEEIEKAQQQADHLIKETEEPRKKESDPQNNNPKEEDLPEIDVEPKEPLSLEELDQRCEDAREEKIAPLREAAIQECVVKKRRASDGLEYCKRFHKDFGEGFVIYNPQGQRTGAQARMFADLPECTEAFNARRENRLR